MEFQHRIPVPIYPSDPEPSRPPQTRVDEYRDWSPGSPPPPTQPSTLPSFITRNPEWATGHPGRGGRNYEYEAWVAQTCGSELNGAAPHGTSSDSPPFPSSSAPSLPHFDPALMSLKSMTDFNDSPPLFEDLRAMAVEEGTGDPEDRIGLESSGISIIAEFLVEVGEPCDIPGLFSVTATRDESLEELHRQVQDESYFNEEEVNSLSGRNILPEFPLIWARVIILRQKLISTESAGHFTSKARVDQERRPLILIIKEELRHFM